MKKLNNKGITTIEVIISFVIVVIISASLYTTVTNYNQKRLIEGYKSKIYTYKNKVTKTIQDDFIKIGLTQASYTNQHLGSSIVHTVNCDLKDGTKRKLIITQRFTESTYHKGDPSVDDYFMIEYGNEEIGDLMQYPLPDIGQSKSASNTVVYDLSINNVLISIEDDNILSIYIGFYHPELMTRYGINIVCPIDFVSKGVDSSGRFNVMDARRTTKKYEFHANGGAGIVNPISSAVGQPFALPGKGMIVKEGYTLKNWNTKPDGTGTTYEFGDIIVPANNDSSITNLYAQWEKVDYVTFSYSGSVRQYTIPADGKYRLEVWGASGGMGCNHGSCNASYAGGLGGYSYGDIQLTRGTTLYIVVGGKGLDATNNNCNGGEGGYNGGGNGGNDENCDLPGIEPGGGGGGATHIATASGLLKDLNSNRNAVLIIGAGGGGGAYAGIGAGGGGFTGLKTGECGTPGTQTEGYAFGQGENGFICSGGAGGSGGGYFGGKTGGCDCPGPGGSSYISGSLLNGHTEENTKSGNGSAKITFISD